MIQKDRNAEHDPEPKHYVSRKDGAGNAGGCRLRRQPVIFREATGTADRLRDVWPIIITVIILVPLLVVAWVRVRRR